MPQLEVLRLRPFRMLFGAQTISVVGNSFTSVALAFGILAATGSARDIGLVLAARIGTVVVFLMVGGVWADRQSRRTIMMQAALVSGVTQVGFAVLFLIHRGVLWEFLVLAAVNGSASAFSQPASTGLLPQLVPAELLRDANALSSIARNTATIGGAAVAGVLVSVAGPGWALAIDAATYFVGAALLTGIPAGRRAEKSAGLIAEMKNGWSAFASRTWVWAIVAQFAILNMAYTMALDVYLPIIAKTDLGGPAVYGAISAALAIGGILGGLLLLRFRPSRPLVAATSGGLVCISFFALVAARTPDWAILSASLLSGVGFEVFGILWAGTLQQEIPLELLSRVSAYDALGSFAFSPIGLALAGPLTVLTHGLYPSLWVAFVVMLVPTLAVFGVRDIWRIRSVRPAQLLATATDA